MRYLLLSVLVVCMVGVMVPSAFAETYTIESAQGSSTPGCEETNNCFIPFLLHIEIGDTVIFQNNDNVAHTFTSGTPEDGQHGFWDSSLVITDDSYTVTFDTEAEYPYFCMVHPWMQGTVVVGEGGDNSYEEYLREQRVAEAELKAEWGESDTTYVLNGELVHEKVPTAGPLGKWKSGLTNVTFHDWMIKEGDGNFKYITLSGTVDPGEKLVTRDNPVEVNLSDYRLVIDEVGDGYEITTISGRVIVDDVYDDGQIFWNWDDYLSPVDFKIVYKVHSNVEKSTPIELWHKIYKGYGHCASCIKVGELQQLNTNVLEPKGGSGGCLIATAAFGSELAPQVQFLRELRDNTVLQTESGSAFMTGFNQFYYSFSPAVADYERENPAFKEAVKITLTPLLTSLTLLQYADIDSESEMLGYGIGVILLNIGMYFVAPAVLIMKIRKRI